MAGAIDGLCSISLWTQAAANQDEGENEGLVLEVQECGREGEEYEREVEHLQYDLWKAWQEVVEWEGTVEGEEKEEKEEDLGQEEGVVEMESQREMKEEKSREEMKEVENLVQDKKMMYPKESELVLETSPNLGRQEDSPQNRQV